MKRIDISKIEISANGRNVRYKGIAQDKCALSFLIHEVAFLAGNLSWPLWSDIYWESSTKLELVVYLSYWLSKCNKDN